MMDDEIDSRDITRETIRAVTDTAELQRMIDTLDDSINVIKTQLEFRTDDNADSNWERRAIGALAMQQSSYNEAMRQMNRLTGRRDANVTQAGRDNLAKALSKQNHLAEAEQGLARKKVQQEAARIATVNEAIRSINTSRFHRNFYRLAQETLPADVFGKLRTGADVATDRATAEGLLRAGLADILKQTSPDVVVIDRDMVTEALQDLHGLAVGDADTGGAFAAADDALQAVRSLIWGHKTEDVRQ